MNPNSILSEREGLSISMMLLDRKWVEGWIISGGWEADKSVIFREFVFLTSLGGKSGEGDKATPVALCLKYQTTRSGNNRVG